MVDKRKKDKSASPKRLLRSKAGSKNRQIGTKNQVTKVIAQEALISDEPSALNMAPMRSE